MSSLPAPRSSALLCIPLRACVYTGSFGLRTQALLPEIPSAGCMTVTAPRSTDAEFAVLPSARSLHTVPRPRDLAFRKTTAVSARANSRPTRAGRFLRPVATSTSPLVYRIERAARPARQAEAAAAVKAGRAGMPGGGVSVGRLVCHATEYGRPPQLPSCAPVGHPKRGHQLRAARPPPPGLTPPFPGTILPLVPRAGGGA